jgi:hypothetical protein
MAAHPTGHRSDVKVGKPGEGSSHRLRAGSYNRKVQGVNNPEGRLYKYQACITSQWMIEYPPPVEKLTMGGLQRKIPVVKSVKKPLIAA